MHVHWGGVANTNKGVPECRGGIERAHERTARARTSGILTLHQPSLFGCSKDLCLSVVFVTCLFDVFDIHVDIV